MQNIPEYIWNEELGKATCILTVNNKKYIGEANCHFEDKDMQSERTGYEIALRKAEILLLKDVKKEMKMKYDAINHLYSTIKLSPKFNPLSFEGKAILRELTNSFCDLTTITEILDERNYSLKDYINKKDTFYKKIRRGRFKRNHPNENS